MSANIKKPSILFVCYANICRSTTAEAVFRNKALSAGLDCMVDSAGTHCVHPGKPADKRSQTVARNKGYSFAGIQSRKVVIEDLENFDYILPMDSSNLDNLIALGNEETAKKTQLFMGYANENIRSRVVDVPDPYRGGMRGFEIVLELIEYASEGLIEHINRTR